MIDYHYHIFFLFITIIIIIVTIIIIVIIITITNIIIIIIPIIIILIPYLFHSGFQYSQAHTYSGICWVGLHMSLHFYMGCWRTHPCLEIKVYICYFNVWSSLPHVVAMLTPSHQVQPSKMCGIWHTALLFEPLSFELPKGVIQVYWARVLCHDIPRLGLVGGSPLTMVQAP